jgi:hypothetical protein
LADFESVKVSYVQSTYFQGLKQHKLKQQICHARYGTLILSSFKSKVSPLLFLADCDGKRGDSGGAVINQNGEAVGIRQGGVMQSQLSSNKKAFTVATNFACMPYARQQDSMSNICKLEKDTYSKNFEEFRHKIFNFDKDPQFKRQWEEESMIEIQKIRSPFQWQFEFQKNTTEANSEAESGVINNVTLKPQCLRREIKTKEAVDLLLPTWEMGWISDSDFIMNNYRKKSFQKTLIKIKRENKKIKIINKNMEFEIPYCESL